MVTLSRYFLFTITFKDDSTMNLKVTKTGYDWITSDKTYTNVGTAFKLRKLIKKNYRGAVKVEFEEYTTPY